MLVQRLNALPRQLYLRLLIYLILGASTVYGLWFVYDMDPYLPWRVRFRKGVFWTTVAHLGLWISMFQIRGWLRFLAIPVFLLSIVGIFVLWWHFSLFAGIIALGCTIWLFFHFLKG